MALVFYTISDTTAEIFVRVTPGSSKNEIVGTYDENYKNIPVSSDHNSKDSTKNVNPRLKIHVTSQAENGAANKKAIELLSKKFKHAKSNFDIKTGHTSRNKTIKISNLSKAKTIEIIEILKNLTQPPLF